MKFLGKQKTKNRQGGYTLLELSITLFIILTITAISRFGKTQYERSLVLTNLAYDIALAVRQAQVYGVNTRQADVTSTGSFNVGYGVRFSSPDSTSFFVFLDADNDRAYGGSDSMVRNGSYTIKNNNRISSVCVVPVTDSTTCTSVVPVLDITFRRPDPDACFNPTGLAVPNARTASSCMTAMPYSEARITIQSPAGNSKVIKVYATGQVTVQ